MISPMTLKEFLAPFSIDYDRVGDSYVLIDCIGGFDLDNDQNEDIDDITYHSIADIVDRVSSLWYDWIDEDLGDEFGCEEDFKGDFQAMYDWIVDHEDDIYPETYKYYTDVLQIIMNPRLLIS